MAGLQRSAVSFRRQGSSGLVWDDKFLSGEINQNQVHRSSKQGGENEEKFDVKREMDATMRSSRSPTTFERNRSNGGQRGYRNGKVSPAIEPPSPKVSACGLCKAFGKPPKNHQKRGVQDFWYKDNDLH
ncbi:hypothetical protein K2173_024385 [Erythroxylum novogranatense]|uniref:MAPK kinase substrate protein n=1 Tax=Erythroxylum novogranatense TaxID=1862640 RepID=A0AAV8SUX5_9ROSI|nr:hypothetical protein K2173_024385 [Erythroxylum novogranatense]